MAAIRVEAEKLQAALEHTPSFLDRLEGAGTIPARVIHYVRPGGPVGRSAGRPMDVRVNRPYGLYGASRIPVPVLPNADARSRFRVRAEELEVSLGILERHISDWSPGMMGGETYAGDRQWGLGMVEAPRGQLTYAVTLNAAGTVEHLALATPSARNWYVVPPAMQNHNILQDFPIIDASFNLSVAGWDQ